MNKELQQLKDIHLPPAINAWPLAPGWIALYVIGLVMVGYIFYVCYQRAKQKITVKFATAKLKHLRELLSDNPNQVNVAAEVSTLIRRTALHYYHREEIAGLTGSAWLDFLNRSGNTMQFTLETGRLLIDAPYQKNSATDLAPLFDLAQAWLTTISKKNGLSAER